jgi:phospholipase/lecithinase/hemolysin
MRPKAPDDFSSLVYFGDSLSDNGNLFRLIGQPPSPPYFEGRFSNGPTYAEIAPDLLSVTAQNFAFGGAEAVTGNGNPGEFPAINLTSQVDQYLASLNGQPAPDGTAAVLFIGNNDYLRASVTPQAPADLIAGVLANVAASVQRLVDAGVDKIILFTLAGIDLTPLGVALGPAAIAAYDQIVQANNAGLKALADGFAGAGVDVEIVDVYRLFTEVKNDTATFGFKIVGTPVIGPDGTPTGIDQIFDPDEIPSFDSVHPTFAGHGVLAAFVAATLGSDNIRLTDAGDDRVNGTFGTDFIMTGVGADTVDGGFGNDIVFAGTGNDLVAGGFRNDLVAGGAGNDRLSGGFGADVVAGNDGDDVVDGGFGDDALIAGRGSDVLIGAVGDDLFLFEDEPDVGDQDHISGGVGVDTLRLTVSAATWASAAFQSDLQQFADSHRPGFGFLDHLLETVGLTADGVDRIEIVLDNRGTMDDPIVFTAGRAAPHTDGDLVANLQKADLWGLF